MKKILSSVFIFVLFNISIVFANYAAIGEQNLVPVYENMSNQKFMEELNYRLRNYGIRTVTPLEEDRVYKDKYFLTYVTITKNGAFIGVSRRENSIYRVSVTFPAYDNRAKDEAFRIILKLIDMIGLDKDERLQLFEFNRDSIAEVWCEKLSRFYSMNMMVERDIELISIMAYR